MSGCNEALAHLGWPAGGEVAAIVGALPGQRRGALFGRAAERGALRGLVDALASGRSEVLVLSGEAGIGKTALLDDMTTSASTCTVLRASGVESDMELAFAGLQQLCAPILQHRSGLPRPQRTALEAAFGLADGDGSPNRFLVGLAVLGLLATAAHDGPVLCVVDDVQWLDQASAQTLFFVARRLQGESVGLVFAQRAPVPGSVGLPVLAVEGVADDAARALLTSSFSGPVDAAIADRVVAEARGNPLALWQTSMYPDAFDPAAQPGRMRPVTAGIEQLYRRRIEALPDETRMFLLVAAAEPLGDPSLLMEALAHLDLKPAVMTPAQDIDVIHVDTRVRFHHPLARSVAYRIATGDQRRGAHSALAAVTDPGVDPDRQAWHRAAAADSPDEGVAADLEKSAARARQRGGTASAAAFLTRAVELTPDPAVRSVRALSAAEAHRETASFGAARMLVRTADSGPLGDLHRGRLAQLRTRLAFASARAGGDPAALVDAVGGFTSVAADVNHLDAALATETYLEAMAAALYVGRSGGGLIADVAAAARAGLADVGPVGPLGLTTSALAERILVGPVEAMPAMRRALDAVIESIHTGVGWFWCGFPLVHDCLVHETFDDRWPVIASHAVATATATGTVALLPAALLSRAGAHAENGELSSTSSAVEKANDLSLAIDYVPLKYHRLLVAAWRGDEADVARMAASAVETSDARGESRVVGLAHYAVAVVNNGLGRYREALDAARRGLDYDDLGFYSELLVESIEAAARCGDLRTAERALDELRQRAAAAGTPRALGTLTRSQALLANGSAAEGLYLRSIECYESTAQRMNLARARLLYGEWLRRNGSTARARELLRIAHQDFVAMGSSAFAERARRELQVAGQKTRRQPVAAGAELSPQERQIAELAGRGLTNQEIAGQLFISAHTVEWHLRKVFAKLAIRSRRELRNRIT